MDVTGVLCVDLCTTIETRTNLHMPMSVYVRKNKSGTF